MPYWDAGGKGRTKGPRERYSLDALPSRIRTIFGRHAKQRSFHESVAIWRAMWHGTCLDQRALTDATDSRTLTETARPWLALPVERWGWSQERRLARNDRIEQTVSTEPQVCEGEGDGLRVCHPAGIIDR